MRISWSALGGICAVVALVFTLFAWAWQQGTKKGQDDMKLQQAVNQSAQNHLDIQSVDAKVGNVGKQVDEIHAMVQAAWGPAPTPTPKKN